NDSQLQSLDLRQPVAGEDAHQRPFALCTRIDDGSAGRFSRPRLLPGEPGNASSDSGPTVDMGNVRKGLAELLLEQREMGAGEDDRVDAVAVGRVEHRLRGGPHGIDADLLAA